MEADSIFENVALSRTSDLADQTHWAELPGSGAWGEATPAPPSSGGWGQRVLPGGRQGDGLGFELHPALEMKAVPRLGRGTEPIP